MAIFGGIYFALPRLVQRDWKQPQLLNLHFWLAASGIIIYAVGLGIGGWLQGLHLTDHSSTFEASVTVTIPYLVTRSVGGSLMLTSHLLFAYNVFQILWGKETKEQSV